MARIIPDGWREIASVASAAALPASAQRHRETLELLARGLPDDYTVYHAVHWTTVERGFSVFGEIDGKDLVCTLHGWRFSLETGECKTTAGKSIRIARRN